MTSTQSADTLTPYAENQAVGVLPPLGYESKISLERGSLPADSPRHFEFVDALRGFAILGVIMVHCCLSVSNIHWRIHDFGMRGMYGVQLFFVVSAFTLFWSLQSRLAVESKPLHAFYVRRFFRIAPLFYLGAIFYTAQHWAWKSQEGPKGFGPAQFIATLFFVHGWHPTSVNTVVPGGWSIGAEFMFYLCIPLLYRYVRSLTSALWLTLASTFVISLLMPIAVKVFERLYPHFEATYIKEFVYWSFPSQIPVFCLGFVLYFLLRDRMSKNPQHPADLSLINRPTASTGLFFTALAVFLIYGTIPPHVLCAAAFVALAYGLALCPLQLVVNRVTRFIGTVSFSAYIWHFWLLDKIRPSLLNHVHFHKNSPAVNGSVRFIALYVVTVLITLPVAALTYYLIEKPGQDLGRMLIAKYGWGRRTRAKIGSAA